MTAARPGVVNFELDIQKEHTVCILDSLISANASKTLLEPPEYPPWRYHRQYGYVTSPLTYTPFILLLTILPVDLGGSLAVASRGLFATGVSTDLSGKSLDKLRSNTLTDKNLSVTYLNSGGKVGDRILAVCSTFYHLYIY